LYQIFSFFDSFACAQEVTAAARDDGFMSEMPFIVTYRVREKFNIQEIKK